MRIKFRTAEVEILPEKVVSTFNDGKINEFYIGEWGENYKTIAEQFGYGNDWRKYGVEHELAHHFIADNMGWQYSWSLYSSAGKRSTEFSGPWPDHIAWEEHLVNAFQRYCKTNERDPHNVLHLCLRQDLDELAHTFNWIADMSLDYGCSLVYNHNNGEVDVVDISEPQTYAA